MPLVLLDIDGTITQTVGVDDSAFLRAFDEVLGLRGFDADWANYPHATDSSLVREIVLRARGTHIDQDEIAAVKQRYFELLQEQAATPGRIVLTTGAGELLKQLRGRAGALGEGGWGLGLASGGWREAAMIKLTAAGLLVFGIPSAFADDALSRADIARMAIARCIPFVWKPGDDDTEMMGVAREMFGGIVSVGDGVWDIRTARELGLGFVGVRPKGDDQRLKSEGARVILKSFKPLGDVLDTLEAEAESPSWR